jgi:hypothetical protein
MGLARVSGVRRSTDRLVPLRARATALLPVATLAVHHQLRFQLAYGENAGHKLAS